VGAALARMLSALRTRDTQHVTTLSCTKLHGLDSVSCVSWRDRSSRIGLVFSILETKGYI